MTCFLHHKFNDYQNNVWCPHKDYSYNAIVYFNKDDIECGTNLYSPESPLPTNLEYVDCWLNKKDYKVIKHIKPIYNSMVIFHGSKFIHGMNIQNDKYFYDSLSKNTPLEKYRCNQIFFI